MLDSFARFALQGHGTPAPVMPPKHLVVTGSYRYVRNPMYVAVTALIIGQGLMFAIGSAQAWNLPTGGMGTSVPARRRLLMVVDDNCDYADSLCEFVDVVSHWDTKAVYSVRAALETAMKRRPDAMVLDLDIPPSSGFEAADVLEQAFPDSKWCVPIRRLSL